MKITLENLGAELSKLNPDVIKYLREALPFPELSRDKKNYPKECLYISEALHHYIRLQEKQIREETFRHSPTYVCDCLNRNAPKLIPYILSISHHWGGGGAGDVTTIFFRFDKEESETWIRSMLDNLHNEI